MKNSPKAEPLRRWRVLIVLAVVFAFGAAIYFSRLRQNPPGFFIDESSIAFNAYTISQHGRDEHGIAWPLFFRAFGDFKNPVYIYVLAAIYRLTGPSILAARLFSATMGILTALGLGWLASRVSRQWKVGLTVALMALLTPWLFELSRVVLEVAMYPLALTLFLLCVRRASTRLAWNWLDVLGLATTLTLLTYSYSIGRLLAPLLALGLVFLITRARLRALLLTWGLYAVSLLPLRIYQVHNLGALTRRFRAITYIAPQNGVLRIVWSFLKHYAVNINPWTLFVTEHSRVSEIIHVYGAQPLLATTGVLVVGSLVVMRGRIDAWWRFILYGLVISILPASLTQEPFHMLRLCAVPVFLLVLTIPALTWLVETQGPARRIGLATILALTLAQGAYFQLQYHRSSDAPRRHNLFDAVFPAHILPTALGARSTGPIYIADSAGRPGYIQAWWYGTLQGIPLETFSRLPPNGSPPEGALVISTEETCPRCRPRLIEGGSYIVYVADGPPRVPRPLPDSAFKAVITVDKFPSILVAGQQAFINVRVKNESNAIWYAREREASLYPIGFGNHWLDKDGNNIVHDDGRGPLTHDLQPGETVEMPLIVNAPARAGDYLLEIDMLQEGVSWFGLKGSKSWRGTVRVE